jgi:hypothetical protein
METAVCILEAVILFLLVYIVQITRIKLYLTDLVKLVKYLVESYVRAGGTEVMRHDAASADMLLAWPNQVLKQSAVEKQPEFRAFYYILYHCQPIDYW